MKSNGNPLLSVLIPCYNCAPVVVRCLDSIDFEDAEIIVINDGSKDNTIEVVEQYIHEMEIGKRKAKNVRLINKSNGGVSSARNMAIREAVGKYICCVDADDYLMADGLKRMVDIAEGEDADVVLYSANYVTEDNLLPVRSVKNNKFERTIFTHGKEILCHYKIPDYYVWDAIYSRKLIIDNRLFFHEDLCLHEDDVFKGEVYAVAGKCIITNLRLYNYVQSSSYSTTHRQSIERQRALIESGWRAVAYRTQFIQDHCPEALSIERLKYMRYVVTPKVALNAQMTLKEYKELLSKYSEWKVYPLRYQWIEIAHWYASPMVKLKYILKTFLINHPCLGFLFYQFCMNK